MKFIKNSGLEWQDAGWGGEEGGGWIQGFPPRVGEMNTGVPPGGGEMNIPPQAVGNKKEEELLLLRDRMDWMGRSGWKDSVNRMDRSGWKNSMDSTYVQDGKEWKKGYDGEEWMKGQYGQDKN